MTDSEYRRALETATREFEALAQKRAEIDTRLAQLTQTIAGLMRLCGYTPTVPLGLTDACRLVLRAAAHPLTVAEIRAMLDATGFDLSKYSNDLAAIHTILKRLTQTGEVHFIARTYGKPAYQWKQPPRTVVMSQRGVKALLEKLPGTVHRRPSTEEEK